MCFAQIKRPRDVVDEQRKVVGKLRGKVGGFRVESVLLLLAAVLAAANEQPLGDALHTDLNQ